MHDMAVMYKNDYLQTKNHLQTIDFNDPKTQKWGTFKKIARSSCGQTNYHHLNTNRMSTCEGKN